MADYWPGQRIKLIAASLPGMQAGDVGAVRLYDPARRLVAVEFDNGNYRTLLLDRGARLEALPTTDESVRAWGQMLVVVYATGQQAGSNAADRWAQDTFAGCAAVEAVSQAQAVLDGLTDGESTVLDMPAMPDVGDPVSPDTIAAVNSGPSGWRTLPTRERAEAHQAYCDGFEAGLFDRAADWCQALLDSRGDGRVVSASPTDAPAHGVGVFAPGWARLDGDPSRMRIGFAGIAHYRTDSWLAFGCTRSVAEALAAELRHHRDDQAAETAGRAEAADGAVHSDADMIVVDEDELLWHPHVLDGLPSDVAPDYRVRVSAQHWQMVAPELCEHLVGDLTERHHQAAGAWLGPAVRVPHRRLQVVRLQPAPPDSPFTAVLLWDGALVGALRRWPHGDLDMRLSDPAAFGSKLHRFLDGCRVGGQPLSRSRVLRALSDGPMLADAIERAYDSGTTLLHLVDPDGITLQHRSLSVAPGGHEPMRPLGTAVADGTADGRWQIWTGRRWRPTSAPIRPS
ncbi:hypothetical protein [Actinoplanes sp. NPDC089786]|uniref:hypothetical protein n=1 Tax=Actinoplanes sp. NPDC089786 TaxID=3155185 RepID=UPI003445AF09